MNVHNYVNALETELVVKTVMVFYFRHSLHHAGSTDNTSYAPLHTASQMGHMAIVVALVEEGADVNVKTGENGDTPLMLSVSMHART